MLHTRQNFNEIMDMTSDPFVLMDATDKVLIWNKAAEAAFGWTKLDVVGKELSSFFIPADGVNTHKEMLRMFTSIKDNSLNADFYLKLAHTFFEKTRLLEVLTSAGTPTTIAAYLIPYKSDNRWFFAAFVKPHLPDTIHVGKANFDLLTTRLKQLLNAEDDVCNSISTLIDTLQQHQTRSPNGNDTNGKDVTSQAGQAGS